MKKVGWVDLYARLLAIVFTIFVSSLTILFILNYKQIPLYSTIFLVLLSLILWYFTLLWFRCGIVVDKLNNKLILYNIKKKVFNVNDIADIIVDTSYSIDPSKYCVTRIIFNDGTQHKFPGYLCINSKKSVTLTLKSIALVKKYMFEKSK